MSMPIRPAQNPAKSSAVMRGIRKSRRPLLGALGLALAWHVLRGVAWTEVGDLLAGIGPLAVLVILGINMLMLPLMTARWWLLLRSLGSPVSLLSVCAYRIAANAVSYLTPGPHFGGEPLSIYLLHHRQGISLASAATSVAVDRLLELAASIAVLILCLIPLTSMKRGPIIGTLELSIAVPAVFICIVAVLFTSGRPLSRCVFLFKRFAGKSFHSTSSTIGSLLDLIIQSETIAESLFREHPFRFLLANLLSLCHWLGVFAEFWLMSVFLGFHLSFWQLTAVLAVARLAFFTPLPAGIGVLESALPWMTATLGLGTALGIGLCLIIRFRDLLFSIAGLGLTMKYLTCLKKASIINKQSG
jgi:uncharacterized protein (TIRG00374 family)